VREKRELKERRSTKRKKDEGKERVDASVRQTMRKGKKKRAVRKGEGMEDVENKAITGRDNELELLFLQTLNVFLLLPAAFLCRDLRKKKSTFSIYTYIYIYIYIYMHTNFM